MEVVGGGQHLGRGPAGRRLRASAVKGIEEITWEAGSRSLAALRRPMTATARPSSTCTVSGRRSPCGPRRPVSTTWSAQRSHIIPGPYFGYWNSSIRLVTCLDLSRRRRPTDERIGSHTAFHRDMPLMRWAPQSAESSEAETPHTFSL